MPLFGERKVNPTSACEGAIEREPNQNQSMRRPSLIEDCTRLFSPHPRRTPRVLLAPRRRCLTGSRWMSGFEGKCPRSAASMVGYSALASALNCRPPRACDGGDER